jgi:ABC-2 type transport system permease protein
MTPQLPGFRVLYTLLRREFAEQRLSFLYLPILAALLACIVLPWRIMRDPFAEMFGRLMEMGAQQGELSGLRQQQITEMWEQRNVLYVREIFLITEGMMFTAFWCSMAYYCLYTLYQQRSNRSILFWNSLPIADWQTIASKLLAGLVCCQLVYQLGLVLVDVTTALAVRVWVGASGVEHWNQYLAEAQLARNALDSLIMMPLRTLWALPVYAWLLLASAWSRRAPFAWATGPWLVLVVAELTFNDKSLVFDKIFEHLFVVDSFLSSTITGTEEGYPATELVLGALLGLGFVAAAVLFNRSDDT